MKIAIIADLHDNEPYLAAFLTYAKNADVLLVCGDTSHIETLKIISESFTGKKYFVFGNSDLFEDKDIPASINNLGNSGIIELDSKKIGLCHEPYKIEKLLKERPYIIFHGHTHTPWIKQEGDAWICNPGTLGGVRTFSTFAMWDTEQPLPKLIRTDLI